MGWNGADLSFIIFIYLFRKTKTCNFINVLSIKNCKIPNAAWFNCFGEHFYEFGYVPFLSIFHLTFPKGIQSEAIRSVCFIKTLIRWSFRLKIRFYNPKDFSPAKNDFFPLDVNCWRNCCFPLIENYFHCAEKKDGFAVKLLNEYKTLVLPTQIMYIYVSWSCFFPCLRCLKAFLRVSMCVCSLAGKAARGGMKTNTSWIAPPSLKVSKSQDLSMKYDGYEDKHSPPHPSPVSKFKVSKS